MELWSLFQGLLGRGVEITCRGNSFARRDSRKSHDGTERELFDIFLIRETKLQHAITQMRNPESSINPIPNRRSSRSTPSSSHVSPSRILETSSFLQQRPKMPSLRNLSTRTSLLAHLGSTYIAFGADIPSAQMPVKSPSETPCLGMPNALLERVINISKDVIK